MSDYFGKQGGSKLKADEIGFVDYGAYDSQNKELVSPFATKKGKNRRLKKPA